MEVEDQVSGLQHIADKTGCIDMNRVGITGWSYGGYMSLVCLAQRPDVFKVRRRPLSNANWCGAGQGGGL